MAKEVFNNAFAGLSRFVAKGVQPGATITSTPVDEDESKITKAAAAKDLNNNLRLTTSTVNTLYDPDLAATITASGRNAVGNTLRALTDDADEFSTASDTDSICDGVDFTMKPSE